MNVNEIRSSSHSKFYVDFGVEMFNKVILTYFTPLSSCGNSLTRLKSSILDCKFIKLLLSTKFLRKWTCNVICILVSTPFVTVLVNWEPGSSCLNKKTLANNAKDYFSKLLNTGWIEIYSVYQVTSIRFPHADDTQIVYHSQRILGDPGAVSQAKKSDESLFSVFSCMGGRGLPPVFVALFLQARLGLRGWTRRG